MVSVYALKLDEEIEDSLFCFLTSKISEDKKGKVERFFRREDAIRCLFADLLIRYILIQSFGLKNETISFRYSHYGKPSLEQLSHLHFNLSHSGEWIVCATDVQPVGIDIERIKPIDLSIAEHYFSEKEKQQLFSLASSVQLNFFYELWTLKESFIKQKGKGLSIPLNSFTVFFESENSIILKEGEKNIPLFFTQYQIDKYYKMAVCRMENSFDDIRMIHLTELIHYFTKGETL